MVEPCLLGYFYMTQNNYILFDITDLNRPYDKKVLWLIELVFVKRGGLIDSLTHHN